ncbi:ArsR family transcriptional regulator [Actinobacteria bacterium YIM 96077]|uniref:Transcriptional regulator n=1 Tax=Phytoactinopolyspora halophila TaxID=1981511 RepID=A0A329QVM3_9ACTN|nr:winged helix-turn-helix domain-containing protein [Phytoactinopolyspora halophila]AYY15557.1 ArsR family transcriptional regulator [Actinobacteria bacterium YIM 96077]RAW15719.1 transcriptional regulator [Phytoactinopolyspora halophila]
MDRKFVEFRLGSSDISTVRFGISPGHELVHAVRVLLRPHTAPLQWGWFRTVQQQTRSEAFRLLAVICGADGYMPDFLTATPSGDMTPEDELERLREVPDERLRFDLEKMVLRSTGTRQQEIRDLIAAPDHARQVIADAWRELWGTLLSPVWPQMLHLSRADIAVRARRSSDAGLAHMAATLHSTITWADEAVRVQMRRHEEIVDCGGTGLVLVPSVMMPTRGCTVLTERPAQPTIFYPAHGVSETWHRDGADVLDALTALLGQARARLILELQQPLSTSECAELTDIAVSTASYHLTVLRDAGLVDSRRTGVRVLHTRTPLGEALAGIR